MDMQEFVVGVDNGNFDTKTSNEAFLSGYTTSIQKPFGVPEDSYIKWNGVYYILTQKRFPYVQDKTVDEKMAVLTLIAIAKEMEFCCKKRFEGTTHPDLFTKQMIQETTKIHLAVGLPPSHLAAQRETTEKYFHELFKNGVSYEYNGYEFSFKLGEFDIYPQNFAVVIAEGRRNKDSIMALYDDYYTLDFGGYTLDKIAIKNRQLSMEDCDSLGEGIVTLCDKVIAKVRKDRGVTIDENNVVSVLKKKRTALADEIVADIKEYTREWTHGVLNMVAQGGVSFQNYPVVFLGGTSLLLEEYIESYPLLGKHEFIRNANANADAYRKLLQNKVAANRK